jgi:hypothetical protein
VEEGYTVLQIDAIYIIVYAVPYNNMNGLNRTMTSYKDYPEFSIFFIGANSCQDN